MLRYISAELTHFGTGTLSRLQYFKRLHMVPSHWHGSHCPQAYISRIYRQRFVAHIACYRFINKLYPVAAPYNTIAADRFRIARVRNL